MNLNAAEPRTRAAELLEIIAGDLRDQAMYASSFTIGESDQYNPKPPSDESPTWIAHWEIGA